MRQFISYGTVILLAMIGIAQAKGEFPGAACFSVLNDVQTFAINARIYHDSSNHNLDMAAEKRSKGDIIGANEELHSYQLNEDDLADSYAALAGSIALASNIGCEKDAISRASKCGFINMGDKCR